MSLLSRSLLLLSVCTLAIADSRAETVRRWTVHALCAQADAIVLAHGKGGDQAVIEKWLFPPKGEQNLPKEITISALEAIPKPEKRHENC